MKRTKIDYNIIITNNYRNLIDTADYIDILLLAEEERNNINKYNVETRNNYLSDFAFERAYLKTKYQDLSKASKALLSANINYTNEQFLRIINDYNLSYENLYNYIKLLDYIKNKKQYGHLNEKDCYYEKKAELISLNLIKKFAKYQHNPNIINIINKMTEMLSYYPNLLTKNAEKIDYIIERR